MTTAAPPGDDAESPSVATRGGTRRGATTTVTTERSEDVAPPSTEGPIGGLTVDELIDLGVEPAPDDGATGDDGTIETAAAAESQRLRFVGAAGRLGRPALIPLATECDGVTSARFEGSDIALEDLDADPATFTVDTGGLDLGTRTVRFECGAGIEATFDLFLYRQNGAARGGANSIATASALGLGSLVLWFGLPAVLVEVDRRRRRSDSPPPPGPTGRPGP